jgi:hypothetical protein
MQNLDQIAEELFNKVRGRFPSVTIGDAEGNVTNEPKQARYFDFDFINEGRPVGKVSISLDDKAVAVVYGEDLVANESDLIKNNWYEFLKELRMFARKRALTFDTRDITKSNLNSRDYKFLATNRNGEDKMNESKLYGTSRVSYQDFDGARLMIKHTESVNSELAAGRTQKIGAIYVESAEGERFKYPYKHLSGARAMARHVSEGGKPFDDFGNYIVGLSEELAKLRKFKTYMGRSAVMAESLAGYMDVVRERIATVKKTVESLQKPNYYKETVASFEAPMLEDVPEDVAENWIDQLTIKQFNEELADVFPYIYKLVSEATKAEEINPDDLDESGLQRYTGIKKYGKKGFEALQKAGREGASEEEKGTIKDKYLKKKAKEEIEVERAFETMMGQFSETQEEKICPACAKPRFVALPETMQEQYEMVSEEKQKGVDGKVCWKGYKRMGTKMKGGKRVDNCVKMEADDLEEAYIKTSKDAIDTLGALRKIGKSIETGDGEYEGNLANKYANDVYDVISWLENNADTNDAKFTQVIEPVVALRKKAKGMETKPGSGKDARFGNEIVNTLYPLMQWIEMNAQGSRVKEDEMDPDGKVQAAIEKFLATNPKNGDALQAFHHKAIDDKNKELDDYLTFLYDYVADQTGAGGTEELGVYDEMLDMLHQMMADKGWSEGNAFAHAVRKAKMDGKKKGDKVKGPDGGEITLEKEKQLPLSEFILSYYDRETGEFPKGETAVLTMVEKDYGEQYIEPAKAFIAKVYEVTEQYREPEDPYMDRMRELAGLR